MLLNVHTVPSRIAGVSVGARPGSVMRMSLSHEPAPSSSAASYCSRGIAVRPPRATTIMNGKPSHRFVRIGATNAQNGSDSHGTAGRWNHCCRIRFTAPYS